MIHSPQVEDLYIGLDEGDCQEQDVFSGEVVT